MRIQELQIDRFGVWRGLNLPLTTSNVTVFYGPNEAGKSTLRRFIRGVLYGYQAQDERTPGPNPSKVSCRGILRLEHEGREYEVMRETQAGSRGRLSVEGDTDPVRSQALLSRILGNAGEGLFENVFAIGLNELQELATLDGADVARHIYGLSLGLDGEKVLTTALTIEQDRKRLLSDDRLTGVIADLAKQLDGVDSQIGKTVDVSQKYVDLLAQREKLEAEVGKTKRRQHDVQQNLRGWKFLESVWGPWNKERTLRAEYNALPSLVGVSEPALDELDKLDREIDSQDTRRRKLIEEARRLYEQAEALQLEPQFEEHVCAIRKLVEQQDTVRATERQLPEKRARLEALRKECEERGASGMMNNPADRLELGSSMTHLLLDRSRRYRSTVASRGRLLKRYKKASAALARKQAAFEEEMRQFGGLSVTQAKANATRRLDELENLLRLRTRQSALEDAHAAASEYLNTATRRRELPPFFYLCLWFFGVAGVILFLAGLYGAFFGLLRDGVGPNVWLIGLCYAFLGACSAGVTWTMKEYFEPQQMDFGGLKQRHRDLEAELNQVNRSMEKILQSESMRPGVAIDATTRLADPNAEITETDVMSAIRRRLVDLDALGGREAAMEETRRRLSLWRQAIQHKQKEVSTARRDWCDLLRKLGLSETIKISEAFQSWEKIAESRSVFSDWQQAQKEHERDRQLVDSFRKTVEELSKDLNPGKPVGDMYLLVSEWDRRLRNLEERRRERVALKSASKQKRRDAEQFDGPIADLRARREALLVRCNSTNRDELVAKIKLLKRAAELATLLSMARSELETVARTEPELALVEDDLLAYDQGRNKRSIEAATDEITQLDRSLQQTYEVLGRVKAELRDLENDRRASSLRYDRAQIQADLHSAIAQLVTGDAAARSLERLRTKLESEGQTGTLKLASGYLSQLTCGKYRRIWAPIGEKHLVVDDEQGQSLRVEHLSSGTREQVFLAARLAMSREFADRGAGLPLVLDDVTVNFDQVRTEAAVKTLLDIADRGQQVLLFTCHQHVANLFQQQGIEPVWLPANAASEFRYAS
ncbi:MAG TPA: AAA family ATPase [Caulifigura sp.]|nr:AAA family ATPase [Caulifigura sp.]